MTQKTNTMAALSVAGLLAVLAPAFAQTAQNSQGQGQGSNMRRQATSMSQQDQKFAMNAAEGSLMEIQAGQLAVKNAASQAVKDFGQRMITDHTKASQQLTQVASQKGMTLPKELSADHRQHRDQLTKATGAQFDRLYMSHMVKAHEKDVKEFEKQAQKGDDAALRAFAEQNLPVLRQHLELARTLASQVGATTDHGNHSGH